MQNSGGNVNAACSLCDEPLETRNHLFSVDIQQKSGRISQEVSWKMITQQSMISTGQNTIKIFALKYVFQATIHGLWLESDDRRHGEASLPPNKMIRMVDRSIRNIFSSILRAWDNRMEGGLQYWFSTRPVLWV